MNQLQDSTEFPIYSLDYGSLSEVLKHLSLVDIFELSFTTDETKKRLREASIPVQSMLVNFDSDLPSIQLKYGRHDLLWTFGYPQDAPMPGKGEYKIGQFNFKCRISNCGYHTQHHDVEHGMIVVIKHLVSIFNCSETIINELSIDVGIIDDSRAICEHFTKFKCLERLAINQTVDREASRLNFAQNFEWIISNLKVDEIYIGVELLEHRLIRCPEGTFDIRPIPMRLDKVLSLKHICLRHAEWMTAQDLLDLDVETAILGDNQFTEEDLNKFITQWISSTSNKLCWLEVQIKENVDKGKITQGFELQDDTYRMKNIKCSCPYRRFESMNAIPFEFPEDSKQISHNNGTDIATISITETTFFFHVKNNGPITPPPPVVPPAPDPNERDLRQRLAQLEIELALLRRQRHFFRPFNAGSPEERRRAIVRHRMEMEVRIGEHEDLCNELRVAINQLLGRPINEQIIPIGRFNVEGNIFDELDDEINDDNEEDEDEDDLINEQLNG